MKLPSLKTLVAASIVLYILHAIEKHFYGFYSTKQFLWVAQQFQGVRFTEAVFVGYEIFFIATLAVMFAIIFVPMATTVFLFLLGVMFILELWHTIAALITMSYYPGLYTSWGFLILGVVYWARLLSDLRNPPPKTTP